MRLQSVISSLLLFAVTSIAFADGLKDNIPDQVRQVPPVGIDVPDADLAKLTGGLGELETAFRKLPKNAQTAKYSADVEILVRAVRQALAHKELFSKRDVQSAHKVLAEGHRRTALLQKGEAPWATAKGLVVRGFRSKIDGTVQPYGLVIPESYEFSGKSRYRLDLWVHGRGERSCEVQFIAGRMSQVGRVSPKDTIVLHPYGRYSNAFKFAGEIDVLEALAHAQQNYKVDDDRVAVRGFSMGGAGCWQMAGHYPDLFFAANPGAGFSETPEFLKFFQKETLNPTWYEKSLWQMYDCNHYVANLRQLPTVAYSGENDIQKQASDIMEAAAAAEGLNLTHLIGPKTGHTIHKDSLTEIERRLSHLAERGRRKMPRKLSLVTCTLKYNRMHWLSVTGLQEHWKQARIDAQISRKNQIVLKTRNVTGLKIDFAPGQSPFGQGEAVTLLVDGQEIDGGLSSTSWDFQAEIHRAGKSWKSGSASSNELRKVRNIQGPIDDAFMDSFLVVRPTGKSSNEAVDKWTRSEMDHFKAQWRQQFRGDARMKDDSVVLKEDIANHNLVLFGDTQSNSLIAKVLAGTPVSWSGSKVKVGDASYDATHYAPILIYPNPLNPKRYVVINSGFTYREYAYLNNARQVPKLPDWAVVDVRTPADSLWPGKIVAADFFDEAWQLKPVP